MIRFARFLFAADLVSAIISKRSSAVTNIVIRNIHPTGAVKGSLLNGHTSSGETILTMYAPKSGSIVVVFEEPVVFSKGIYVSLLTTIYSYVGYAME